MCVWLAARFVAERRVPRVPWLLVVYLLWVVAGLVSDAAAGAVVTSLRNFTLLPVLAWLIVDRGVREREVRILVGTLVALCAFEFLVTIAQTFRYGDDSDSIVGSFGVSANAVIGAVVLLVACVGLAGFLEGAPWGRRGLVAAAVLPLFAAWTVVKIVPILLVLGAVAIIVPALVLRRSDWRRALIGMAALAASAAAIVGAYAAFKPDSFDALFGSGARDAYVKNAAIYQPPPPTQGLPASGSTTTTPASTGRPVPGRTTQWRMARDEIAGSSTTELFGKGLGSATVAENLGVKPEDISANAEAASYSDFGTLLVERGWTGWAWSPPSRRCCRLRRCV